MSTLVTVRVLVNRNPMRFSNAWLSGPQYQPDPSGFEAALTFLTPSEQPEAICEKTFAMLNSPSAPRVGTVMARQVALYHQRFPSLSVGDAVKVDGRVFICRDCGFEPL